MAAKLEAVKTLMNKLTEDLKSINLLPHRMSLHTLQPSCTGRDTDCRQNGTPSSKNSRSMGVILPMPVLYSRKKYVHRGTTARHAANANDRG
jgi:hypothetical protein